ncbi:hypothetical protein J6590_024221 [Homalodisca vitripennis]|nr:hypothetical protein J6590_024221 [Homalodisca vitripennis]
MWLECYTRYDTDETAPDIGEVRCDVDLITVITPLFLDCPSQQVPSVGYEYCRPDIMGPVEVCWQIWLLCQNGR